MGRIETIESDLNGVFASVKNLAKEEYNRGYKDGMNSGFTWHEIGKRPEPPTQTEILATISLREKYRNGEYDDVFDNEPEKDETVSGYFYDRQFFVNGRPLSYRMEVVGWAEFPYPMKREVVEKSE